MTRPVRTRETIRLVIGREVSTRARSRARTSNRPQWTRRPARRSFGALGALVSRQEDVGGATAPVLMALVVPYILSITILPSNPTNGFMAALSFVPFFSPMIMPMRIALGVAPLWQPLLALVLTLALIALLVWFAGRVYSNAVLRMGAKVRLREALSSH